MRIIRETGHQLFVLCIIAVCVVGSGGWTVAAGKTTIIVDSGTCSDIQSAIDSLCSQGGRIIVRQGTYQCATPIVIDCNKVELLGDTSDVVLNDPNPQAPILRLNDHANSPVLILGQKQAQPDTTRRGIRVADFIIDGNRLNQDTEAWPEVPAIRNNGIVLRRVENVIIERVTAHSARSGGLVSELGCRGLKVRKFVSFDNEFDGLAGYLTERSKYMDLYLYDNQAAGLSFDLRFNRNVIRHAVIANSGTVAIFIRSAHENMFSRIDVIGCAEHGLFLAENRDPGVDPPDPATDNIFEAVVVTGCAQAGARVNDASCVGNKLSNAQLVHNLEGCVSKDVPGTLETSRIVCR